MMSIQNPTGRLCQVVVSSPLTVPEVAAFMAKLPPMFQKVGGQAVFAVDLRGANVFPVDVAEKLQALLQSDNAAIIKSAYLMAPGAVFGMQVGRLIRDAKNPNRRAFTDPAELKRFLSEVATPDEAAAAERFFARAAA
ncbi:MAG: hypothetical protein KC933_18350 [Myxococcales bacterium]|nr:hypothetical protein [Myxococcales bacterium]MCB9651532.1 hypothetical protein [Deltaproteobacteria bacterium]